MRQLLNRAFVKSIKTDKIPASELSHPFPELSPSTPHQFLKRTAINKMTRLSTILLLAFLQQSVSAVPSAAVDSTAVVANWHLDAYSDGACAQHIHNAGGNTPKGCTNLSGQARSYKFTSFADPKSGVQYAVKFYTGYNCQYQDGTDNGDTDGCRAKVFESYEVYSS